MNVAPINLKVALFSAAVLGFRHGFDYDHIAAISDIASVQSSPRATMRLGMAYAVGHAITVAALGSAAIVFQLALPPGLDRIAERLVGFTLIVLGFYVLGSLVWGGKDHLPHSRFMLLTRAAYWLHWKTRRLLGMETGDQPKQWSGGYDTRSVVFIGVIHGLGAETPSQLMIFFLAANLGGTSRGFLGLAMFLAGLLAMNALTTASAAGLFGLTDRIIQLRRTAAVVVALYSLAVGILFLLGSSDLLPPLSG